MKKYRISDHYFLYLKITFALKSNFNIYFFEIFTYLESIKSDVRKYEKIENSLILSNINHFCLILLSK